MSKVIAKVGDKIVIHHDVGYTEGLLLLLTEKIQTVVEMSGSSAGVSIPSRPSMFGSDKNWYVGKAYYTVVETQEIH